MTESISEAFTSYVSTGRELAPEEGVIDPDPIIAATGEDKESVVDPDDVTEAELEQLTAPDDTPDETEPEVPVDETEPADEEPADEEPDADEVTE